MTRPISIKHSAAAAISILLSLLPSSRGNCTAETSQILSNTRVDETSKNFLKAFSQECSSSQDLCEEPVYNSAAARRSITHLMNYSVLKESKEFQDLYDACLSHNFVPVTLSDEVRFKDKDGYQVGKERFLDKRIVGNGLLHCFPAECATDVEHMREAYFAFIGKQLTDATEHLDFYRDSSPFDVPVGVSGCDPQNAGWSSWSSQLQNAYNNYIAKINNDCKIFEKNDCSTTYRSFGEHHARTYNLYKTYNSQLFREYAEACSTTGGILCAFDMRVSYQASKSNAVWGEDRGEVVYSFNGYPDCYARSCTYEEMEDSTQKRHVQNLFTKLTDSLYESRRELEENESLKISDADISNNLDLRKNTPNSESSVTSLRGDRRSLLTEDAPIILVRSANSQVQDYSLIPEKTIFDYLLDNAEITSPYIEERSYQIYTGKEECGPRASSCYTRLSNFCLRQY